LKALLAVDVQNEFSAGGLRPVTDHSAVLARIAAITSEFRAARLPIAWIRHFNRPNESRAFVPGTWGSELSPGMGPQVGFGEEIIFEKDVFGAFSGTELEAWLRRLGVTEVVIVGFYSHMCVSTTSREALVRGFDVEVILDATGATGIEHPELGTQSAEEVRRTALLQLSHMGTKITRAVAALAK
jgi:nicotinamidase-related amidase